MCGIFGFVGERRRAQTIDVAAALKSLHHRGPDDSGTFVGVSRSDPDFACAFAHTRLSIIDLSAAGHQPMTSQDGRYTIVYNGEVYNFQAIRTELESCGCRFVSNCDTEVVLNSYIRWGTGCMERLRGMFAFAIWDAQLGKLFLCRDRLGVKPLYYTKTKGGVAFASEVRTLMDCGVADRRISREGLNSYLAFGSTAEPLTIVDDVFSLPPGGFADIDKLDVRLSRYWSLPEERVAPGLDGARQINDVVRSSILSEIDADVPVGVFLSGGIDSSAIVAVAASAAQRPVQTFTVTFDETRYNEEKYAAEVASRYGCDHHQVHLSAQSVVSQIDSMIDALDQPSADGVNTYFVARAARDAGLAVVLSGVGGDELFGGYTNFRSFGPMLSIGKAAAPLARFFPVRRESPFSNKTRRARKMTALVRAGGRPRETYAVLRSMFSDEQVAALQPEPYRGSYSAGESIDACNDSVDAVNLYSCLELKNYMRNTLLRDADAMSMASSLEVRVPLLDHLLVEAMMRLPGTIKLSKQVNKPLLASAARTLPATVLNRPKMGFTVPLEEWLRGPFQERVADLFGADSIRRQNVLDSGSVGDVWRAFTRGERYMNYSRVWCLFALIAWCERNGVSR